MAITAVLDMQMGSELLDEALAVLKDGMGAVRMREGCEYVRVYQQQDDPTHVVVMTRWVSDETFAAYLASRAASAHADPLAEYRVGSPTMIRLVDAPGI